MIADAANAAVADGDAVAVDASDAADVVDAMIADADCDDGGVIDVLVVEAVFCRRLCRLNSRFSVSLLELARHSRCSLGFLNRPFLL